jgi:hypothetical protein
MPSFTTNPFKYGGIVHAEHFAGRQADIAALRSDMLAGQNVILSAPRRTGKSSLVRATVDSLAGAPVQVVQVDLMQCPSVASLTQQLIRSMLAVSHSKKFSAERWASKVLGSLSASATFEITEKGVSPKISIKAGAASDQQHEALLEALRSLERLAEYSKQRVVLVMDEFQEIVKLDETLIAPMRGIFQAQTDIAHIYLGSNEGMMQALFHDPKAPLYDSGRPMSMRDITSAEWHAFITERFASTRRVIDPDEVDELLSRALLRPYDVQKFCYALWQQVPEGVAVEAKHIAMAVDDVVRGDDNYFFSLWSELTKPQQAMMQVLAQGPIERMFSAAHEELGTASHRQTMIKALTAKGLVSKQESAYTISVPFLAEWINRG